ncbi:MAG: biotin/lipoyl-binding protein [Pseudobutyrivibrio sp.]|uniref:biotin/lipoyl-containing protein n=1 Tax=Pseudobutyrivibrio sp. TaxID=2014367 RepID=UPI001B28310C|nr:biotin/lipoyl-containing protein [Pseudobutyrivibrio sp.]MBO5617972.1 biotin/lipoyl-binding protein [Pseudobutyrivibrio sp.]MBO6283005.1 biotin/lipoyl-binding protein [Pseudobutyrivibrio sp.]MBQ8489498.1 biotin/lipoyl-binding protein [Pseudobutyrivibrio sp.]
MKNYTITVNGTVYDVTVEDKGGSGVSPVTPAAAPKAAAPAAPASTGSAGAVKIEAGAAGKVVKIAASAGTAVKKGDPVVVLEVMKMETPVVAPQDGTVASINCNEGQQVDAGALLATMN